MILNIIGYTFLTIIAAACFLPFLLVLSSSLTAEKAILTEGYRLIPSVWSLESYRLMFQMPGKIINAYMITIIVTVIGTALSLFLMSMTAYVLQRKDFKWRNHFAFYFFFTTLFSGGLVPFYILVNNYLQLQDTIAVQILPMVINVFYIIVMKAFISSSIPMEITESAKIDGAGDFTIYARLILPLSKPALASIGLLTALSYWNDWYLPLLFISDQDLIPMQYYLYKTLINFQELQNAMVGSGQVIHSTDVPVESMKMGMTIIAAGPIMLAYPFIQRYFIQGLTIGAVKG
ncbi:carbohydrate ABC transporter permease [Paenibacillus alkalitolerans]|uniref:carbohydrate ABC transporter permease n=1 Tax=Paenibacillus alkalitolerans TaxID=2799335 RepID=UPI001F1FA7CB|nr:carbohydrate ABC transporter permease [Paenibacillus alkalitolerans]